MYTPSLSADACSPYSMRSIAAVDSTGNLARMCGSTLHRYHNEVWLQYGFLKCIREIATPLLDGSLSGVHHCLLQPDVHLCKPC